MSKQLFHYFIVFFVLYFFGFQIHQVILENQQVNLSFSLQKIYLFHLCFSLLVCVHFKLLSTVDKIFQQLGFIYLVTIFLKIILFSIIFYNPIFTEENLEISSKISLLIPAIVFLLTEAFFVVKILNQKQ